MRNLFLFGLIVFPAVWAVTAQSPTDSRFERLDNQLWNETQFVFPLVKKKDADGESVDKLSFFLQTNLRIGRNVSNFTTRRVGFGFDYRLNKYVSFTPSYVYINSQSPVNREKQYETRVRLAVNLEKEWKRFSLDDRNLIERRFRNSSDDDTVRYRNRLRLRVPIKRGGKELFVPFAWNEIYYDFRAGEFSRNQFALGATRQINKNLTAELFYLRRANRSETPRRINAFGVNLTVKID